MADKLPATFRASQKAQRRAQRFARDSGFSTASDVLEAIGGNASTTIKGNRAALTRDQARLQGAISRIASRTREQQARTTARTGHQIQTRYGSAVAGAAAPAMANVEAVQKASGQVTRGNQAAGRLEAAGGQQAMGLIQAGVTEANAAAAAQLAEAKNYRVQDDAKLLAEQRFQMIQMRTQAALQWKYEKKKMDYLQKLESGSQGGLTGMTASVQSAASSYTGLQQALNEGLAESPGPGYKQAEDGKWYPTGATAAGLYVQENGITDPNEVSLILGLGSALYRAGAGPVSAGSLYGQGTSEADRRSIIQEAFTSQLLRMYPQFAKHRTSILEALNSSLDRINTLNSWDAYRRVLGLPMETDTSGPGILEENFLTDMFGG